MPELAAQSAVIRDALGPGHHQRIAGGAEVRGNRLGPLDRRNHGPGPCGRIVGTGVTVPEAIETRQHPATIFAQTLECAHVVEAAAQSALGRGAVVTDDVNEERVVEQALLL